MDKDKAMVRATMNRITPFSRVCLRRPTPAAATSQPPRALAASTFQTPSITQIEDFIARLQHGLSTATHSGYHDAGRTRRREATISCILLALGGNLVDGKLKSMP
ncbi:uncharacterized protein G2W53_029816 [Senna tora]|uniref:Uncharacterized protein n=1 Tax=Senna tora TaxID=362788 RepID=A0A834T5V4_9FABA|nr:uncharacterized protein G2W53_029816 [Senna tora]